MTSVLARVTAQQFEEEFDTRGLELIHGEVVEVEMGAESSLVAKKMLYAVEAAIGGSGGIAFPNDVGIQVWPDRPDHVRKPDGMFFARDRLSTVPSGWIEAVPSLVWEVVSPHDRAPILRDKLEDYRQAGVPLVWVLYPGMRIVDVHRPDGSSIRLGPDDQLTGGDVLPEFSVKVAELFVVP
jgi:Uma2 family endonuclease